MCTAWNIYTEKKESMSNGKDACSMRFHWNVSSLEWMEIMGFPLRTFLRRQRKAQKSV